MRIINIFLPILFIILSLNSCTSYFYYPDRYLHHNPVKAGLDLENIYFHSPDGTKLHGWHLKAKRPKGLIFFLHGNAQNISSHYLSLVWLVELGYDIFAMDYRGYGISEGSPSPRGVYEDSVAGLDLAYKIYQKRQVKDFILIGQSLGGAILTFAFDQFKFKNEVKLLVLDSTFYSYKKMANFVLKKSFITWPISPLSAILISDTYSTEKIIPKIQIPVLVIHGTRDRIVPYQFGKDIFNLLTTKDKWFWTIEEGEHLDVFFSHDKKYRKKFLSLLDSLSDHNT